MLSKHLFQIKCEINEVNMRAVPERDKSSKDSFNLLNDKRQEMIPIMQVELTLNFTY